MIKLKEERSNYSFEITCDNNIINEIIQAYLKANNFKLISKNGKEFYRAGDAFIQGYRGFTYYFDVKKVNISVWLIGVFGKEFKLEQNALNIMAMDYRNSLNSLFKQISNINKEEFNNE